MNYDIFISYRREGGSAMAKLLYECLKNMNYSVFLDVDELTSGPFNERLYQAIDGCTDFLLVLPENALDRCRQENDWLRFEIERALSGNKNIIPVVTESFRWESITSDFPDSVKKLSSYNDVQIIMRYFDAGMGKILSMLKSEKRSAPAQSQASAPAAQRNKNHYFSSENKKELRRLAIQQDLIAGFESNVYQRAKDRFEELRVLDLGSNNGDFIMDRLGTDPKVSKLVGFEYDGGSVAVANRKYGVDGKIFFAEGDVEDEGFSDQIRQVMEEMEIESFNVINISMLLLHLKSPYKLLKLLRPFLCRGGVVIIKDIDDGFNLAYPDEDGAFERVVSICSRNDTSGYRYSGRQIYTFLKRSGYKSIRLENCGLTTVGMSYEEREALFDTYFSFILEDLLLMVKRHPEDKRFAEDLDWYRGIYDDLEQRFQDDDFFFSLGFILYTAEK